MSKYTPRTTAPSKDNHFYYKDNIFYKCGYGMPNCTCYAWGRFYELTNQYPKLSTANAKNWYLKNDGYQRGKNPKLGAIACWNSNDAGHVAVVEEIFADGSFNCSNSAWSGSNFYMKRIYPPYNFNGFKFQGFIYNPINFDNQAPTPQPSSKTVNVYYKVKTKKHGWLAEVKNLNDFAGYENSPITDVAIKVDKGSIKYRVHVRGGDWLPWVTGYNINDIKNGYAGNGCEIDAIQVYYFTPNDIRPYKKAKYKVNNYPYQYDEEKTSGQDGYAGAFGVSVTKFQIVIE